MDQKRVTAFGDRIRELRKAKALTQKELAESVGLDFTYLSKIEAGLVPSEDKIRELARVLGTDAAQLVLLAERVPDSAKPAVSSALLRALEKDDLTDEDLKAIVDTLRARRTRDR